MTRKSDGIQNLLAARVRRTPPTSIRPVETAAGSPRLRISRGDCVNQHPGESAVPNDQTRDSVQRLGRAIELADLALAQIESILVESRRVRWPALETDRGASAGDFGALLGRINRIIESTRLDGRPLLRADWSFLARGAGSPIDPDQPSRAGGRTRFKNGLVLFMDSLQLNVPMDGASPQVAARTMSTAIRRLRAVRRLIADYKARELAPVHDALQIAAENTAAALLAANDFDFAHVASRLTPADALAARQQSTHAYPRPARRQFRTPH